MELPDKPIRALVRCLSGLQHPSINFEVTIDPARALPGSDFVRFVRFGAWAGDKKGHADELTGWMHLNDWEIVHVIGEVDESGNVKVSP